VQSQEPSTTTPSPAPSSPPSMYTIVPWTPVTMVFLTFRNFYRHSLFSVPFEEHTVPCIQLQVLYDSVSLAVCMCYGSEEQIADTCCPYIFDVNIAYLAFLN